MPLTQVQKEILLGKHGVYSGTILEQRRMGNWNKPTSLSLLKLQKTQKTWRACRVCRGNGVITGIFKGRELIPGVESTAPLIQMRCNHCGGAKVVFG